MSKLVRFRDSRSQCWSRVDLGNGDPIWISIAQAGVVVKRSRMGWLGPLLYGERNVTKAARTAQLLDASITAYATPPRMTNPVLRAFTQVALESSSAAQLAVRLSKAAETAPEQAAGSLEQSLDAARDLVAAYGSVLEQAANSGASLYSEELFPASKDAIKKAILTVALAESGSAAPSSRLEQLRVGCMLLAEIVPKADALEASRVAALMAAPDLTKEQLVETVQRVATLDPEWHPLLGKQAMAARGAESTALLAEFDAVVARVARKT